MNIIAIDDERLALQAILEILENVFPKEKIQGFQSAGKLIKYADELKQDGQIIDYAFLDIEIYGETGLVLAKQLKEYFPEVKIVFCTAYQGYAVDAWKLHAIGYLLKPVTEEAVLETLDEMDKGWKTKGKSQAEGIRVQTFGNFEIFINESLISFEREKAKELLAYLIDRRGAAVTNAEIAAVLWEGEPEDERIRNYVKVIVTTLRRNLKNVGADDILQKSRGHLAVDMSKVKSDFDDFIKGDAFAVNAYHGEYMANYSWAEFTNASLMKKSEL